MLRISVGCILLVLVACTSKNHNPIHEMALSQHWQLLSSEAANATQKLVFAQISYYSFQACGFFFAVMYPIIISLALNSVAQHHGFFAGILMTGIMGGVVVQFIIGLISDFTSLRVGMFFNFVHRLYFESGLLGQAILNNKTISIKKIFTSQKK
jgi:fucose permease